MKTVMKKLFSLMLVAVLLVSAVPFAASADEVPCSRGFDCKHEGVNHIAGCPMIPCNPAACDHGGYSHQPDCPKACNGQLDCPQYAAGHTGSEYHKAGCLAISKSDVSIDDGVACTKSYSCKHVGNNHVVGCPMIPCSNSADCDHGGWDHLPTCPLAVTGCSANENCRAALHHETCPFYVASDSNNGGSNNGGSNNGGSSNGGSNGGVNDYYGDEAMKDIWLYIYTNTNMTTPSKRVLLNDKAIISDGVVDKAQILSIIDDYYKATDRNKGIIWKGMYKSYASNVATNLQFVNGQLYDELTGLKEDRYNDVVIIMARVTGVTSVSSSSATADSSNPKTGDMIMAPAAVLAMSASALAVLFYLNKKRAY